MDSVLNVSPSLQGLSSAQAQARLLQYGPNLLEQKRLSSVIKFLRWLISPISLMLLGAAALSYVAGKGFDFYFILFLAAFNFCISFWQEHKADSAIEKLRAHLSIMSHVLRDGVWKKIPTPQLVPDDVVLLGVGDVVPADVSFLSASNVSINEAALSGESLPVDKKEGDGAYSGSFIVTGRAVAVVRATGNKTYFGKTLALVEKDSRRSILEKDILRIARFLSALSIGAVIILSIVFALLKIPALDILTLDLSLIIAGIPISLPTVMTLIISLGVLQLTKKNVVVRRLSSLEDLANVTTLLTDKTGTLTKNDITIHDIRVYRGDEQTLLSYAALASLNDNQGPIRNAILQKAAQEHIVPNPKDVLDFVPADSERKYSGATARINGSRFALSLGAPFVIEKLVSLSVLERDQFHTDIEKAAKGGFRSLALSASPFGKPKQASLIGIFLLSDTIRPDAKDIISFLHKSGINVQMVTGDHAAISQRVGAQLGLESDAIHSQILPADKYELVKQYMENGTIAVTGDGVNDLPAIKAADVGIAVGSAVDALKSSADIVLLSSGIAVIKDAIIEAKKIFRRLYTYSLYRISESFRVIISILILGILYKAYPLTPIHLILLALLNDIPIISLAYNRVKVADKPSDIKVRERFTLSSLFGLVGLANSLILFFIMDSFLHLPWEMIQTIFFLKLAVSGHLLIYVAHTSQRWYKFLPSWQVISATLGTQLIASTLAFVGIFMSPIPLVWIAVVWVWSFIWMQTGEGVKIIHSRFVKP